MRVKEGRKKLLPWVWSSFPDKHMRLAGWEPRWFLLYHMSSAWIKNDMGEKLCFTELCCQVYRQWWVTSSEFWHSNQFSSMVWRWNELRCLFKPFISSQKNNNNFLVLCRDEPCSLPNFSKLVLHLPALSSRTSHNCGNVLLCAGQYSTTRCMWTHVEPLKWG